MAIEEESEKIENFASEKFDAYCKRLGIDKTDVLDFFEYDKFHESPEFEEIMNSIPNYELKLRFAYLERSEHWCKKLYDMFNKEQGYFHLAVLAERYILSIAEWKTKLRKTYDN